MGSHLSNIEKEFDSNVILSDRKKWTVIMHNEFDTFKILFKTCFAGNMSILYFNYSLSQITNDQDKKEYIVSNFNTVVDCPPTFAHKLQRKLLYETFIGFGFVYDESMKLFINTINDMHHNPAYIKQNRVHNDIDNYYLCAAKNLRFTKDDQSMTNSCLTILGSTETKTNGSKSNNHPNNASTMDYGCSNNKQDHKEEYKDNTIQNSKENPIDVCLHSLYNYFISLIFFD